MCPGRRRSLVAPWSDPRAAGVHMPAVAPPSTRCLFVSLSLACVFACSVLFITCQRNVVRRRGSRTVATVTGWCCLIAGAVGVGAPVRPSLDAHPGSLGTHGTTGATGGLRSWHRCLVATVILRLNGRLRHTTIATNLVASLVASSSSTTCGVDIDCWCWSGTRDLKRGLPQCACVSRLAFPFPLAFALAFAFPLPLSLALPRVW